MGAIRLSVSYAARQIYAQTTAAAAVTLVVLALSRNTVGDARELLTQANLVALISLMVAAAIVDTVVGWVNVHPTFKWFAAGRIPRRNSSAPPCGSHRGRPSSSSPPGR